MTLTFYTPFDSALKVIFNQFRMQSDTLYPFHDKISASTHTHKKSNKILPIESDSSAYFSQQPEPKPFFPHHTIAYNLKLRDTD